MKGADRVPFVAWPGWTHARYAAQLIALVGAWFCLVFVGADWLTAHRATRVRVHLDAELRLPLVPVFLIAYMSIYLLFLAVPFVLRTRREAASLATAQFITILVAGVGFLLIPGQLAYAPPGDLGVWGPLLHSADRLNLDYNLVPSLHVAMSVVCIEAFSRRAGPDWQDRVARLGAPDRRIHAVDTSASRARRGHGIWPGDRRCGKGSSPGNRRRWAHSQHIGLERNKPKI